jgi:holo-[acyl-carrier protein] synthase
MIIGSGIDIIEIKRLKKAIRKWGNSFLHRVFSDEEIKYAKKRRFPYEHLAARFAAKEAVLKAIGDNNQIGWHDIKIFNDRHGRPICTLSNKKDKNKTEILISISHTKEYAVASAIITKKA